MISPVDTSLELAPKALDGVGVDIAFNPLLARVLDFAMNIAHRAHLVIGCELIGHNAGAKFDILPHDGQDGRPLSVRHDFGSDITFPLDEAKDSGLMFPAPSTLRTFFSSGSNIGFIGLNDPRKVPARLGEQESNLFSHSPSAFIGNSQLPLKLFTRYTVLGIGEKKDSIEPGLQRGIRFMKDSLRKGMNLMTAELTAVAFAFRDTVEFSFFGAGRADLQ